MTISVVAAVAFGLLAATSRPQDAAATLADRVSTLENEVGKLRDEVALIRRIVVSNGSGSGVAPGPKAPPAVQTDPFVGKLAEIKLLAVDPQAKARVASLRKEATELDERARKLELDATGKSPDARAANDLKKRQAADLRDKARKTRGEAERLQRSIDSPDKQLCVWNGTRVVVLQVPSEKYSSIRQVPLGGFVTWEGERLQGRADLELFVVKSIREAAEPAGFGFAGVVDTGQRGHRERQG